MGRETDNEMRQIQQGLESFLQQERQEMEIEAEQQKMSEPQLYTIEEEEETEKELDIIGSTSSRRRAPAKRREDYYIEDWDSPEREKQDYRQEEEMLSGGRSGQVRGAASRSRSGQGQGAASRSRSGQVQEAASRKSNRNGSQTESMKQSNRRSRKKRGSGLKKLLITAVLLIALAAGGLYFLVGRVYGRMNYEKIDSFAGLPMSEDGVVNILLIGNDSRMNGEDGRSDAMILISISSKTKKIYMTSLLRDMYVEIPGHDGNRLNAAYSYGGAELLMETVKKNLDIPVNRYIQVNF